MRQVMLIGLTVVLCGCAGGQDEASTAADTAAVAAPAAPAPAPLALSDLTGTWNVEVKPETSDSVVLKYVLNAPADTSKWTIKFEGRPTPVAIHVVALDGDSLMTRTGEYQSALRRGVMVSTEAVVRLQNGRLIGTTVGHYKTTGPDSVRTFRTEGTRGQ